ncbi:MAG TPA: AbrB/MazE/SpoVT family DNA-binding domain-containing protein [Caulobacteraceae bacterium]|jgi:antitoxin VapB
MTVATGRIVHRDGDEIVLLPDQVAFDAELEVTIVRSGDVLTIYPKRSSAAELLPDHEPGADGPPERPGL